MATKKTLHKKAASKQKTAWVPIDPKTPPADIVAMATGKKPIVPLKQKTKPKPATKKAETSKRLEAMDEYGLIPHEREFADLYRGGPPGIIGNATQSFKKLRPHVTQKTAEQSGSKLLNSAKVSAYIKMRSLEVSEECGVNAKWLLKRLVDEANADLADLYHEGGGMKPVHEWPEIWRKGLVAGLEVKQEFVYEDGERVPDGFILKAKMSDRIKRLELIGKHVDIQAFLDKVEVKGEIELADRLSRARKRVAENG